jgi:hypothetical protein
MTNEIKAESIDEVVDRVAARLTAVPVDPTFSDRVRRRLDHGRSVFETPAFAIVAALAVIAAASTMMWRFSGERVDVVVRQIPARGLAPVSPLRQPIAQAVVPEREPQVDRRRAALASALPTSVPATEDNATATPPLVVAGLEVAALMGPAQTEVAPLEIAPLEIPELQVPKDGTKEPR